MANQKLKESKKPKPKKKTIEKEIERDDSIVHRLKKKTPASIVREEVKKERAKQRTQEEIKRDVQSVKEEREKRFEKGSEYFYDEDIANEIIKEVCTQPKRLKHILNENPRFPQDERIVFWWIHTNEDFAKKYSKAKREQQKLWVDYQWDEIDKARNDRYVDNNGNLRIDSGAVALAKLACDNIKWEAARTDAKTYSDKTTINIKDDEIIEKQKKMLERLTGMKKKYEKPY